MEEDISHGLLYMLALRLATMQCSIIHVGGIQDFCGYSRVRESHNICDVTLLNLYSPMRISLWYT